MSTRRPLGRRRRTPGLYRASIRELRRRAEAMTQGDFSTLGQPIDGPREVEDLRRAIDVLGEHVEQFHRGMHASVAALTTAQETERGRLARELHDDIVQRLIALGQGVDRAQRALDREPSSAQERLGQLRGDITTAVQAVRAVIGDLRPPALEELGLLPAVEFLLQRAEPGRPDVTIDIKGSTRRLDPQSELALFRIVQEAWNNIRRHAQATRARFTFDYTRNALVVTIEDDGRGFVPDAGQAGWGLIGMRERAALVGGSIAVQSAPGHGTRVVVRMPYLGVGGRDPICGMEVGPDALHTEYEGTLYRFCSQACHDLFVAQPERYAQQAR
jgi:signal transduction histidine kinase/YHS domain-containing protein